MDPRSHGSYPIRAFEFQFFTTNFREVLCIILVLTLLAISGVSQSQPRGFINIDCGSTNGSRDRVTGLEWETDEMFLDSAPQLADAEAAIVALVNPVEEIVTSRDNAEQLNYAMAFIPGRTSHSKYCYNLNVSETNVNTTTYLVRAMFPTKRLRATTGEELNGYGTRFYFTVDSTLVATIELDPVEPQTVELVVSSLDEFIYICLVPLEDKSSMVAISSIELRPLPQQAYARDGQTNTKSNSATSTTTYLMTVARLNFGGNESLPSVRYPNDTYDRLWSAAKIPESKLSEITSKRNTDIGYTPQEGRTDDAEPGAVMISAWEGVFMTSEMSFNLSSNIRAARSYRPLPTFYLRMGFWDIDPGGDSDRRVVDIFLDHTAVVSETPWAPDVTVSARTILWIYNSKQMFWGDSATFRIKPNDNSTLPAMVNVVDILGEFEAVTERTAKTDALAIGVFSDMFPNIVDAAGDPCLPVPWNWLVCSLEIPPRITQINLTGEGGRGNFPANLDFGSLNRLTVLDISKNSLTGSLPKSLIEIVSLRALNIDSNNLSGGLPPIEEKSLVNLQTLSLRNNTLSGDILALIKALGSPASSLDLGHNRFNGPIPVEIKELKNMENLDLSYNQLESSLPSELFLLPKLKTLNLKNNSLEGQVPDDIWRSEGNSPKLHTVNLDGNKFTEINLTTWSQTVLVNGSFRVYQLEVSLLGNPIESVTMPSQDGMDRLCPEPEAESQIPAGFILLGDNPWCRNLSKFSMTVTQRYLCRSRQSENFCSPQLDSKDESKTGLIIGLAVSGCVILLMACVLVFSLARMWKRMKDLHQIQEALAKDDVRPPFFKYEDLKAATENFSQENELGKGAFGAVYKAKLPDGSFVAVKLLFPTEQNIADFLKEMVLITGIKHKHLIQLKGCCVRDKKRILVYEYAENGNLAEALWDGSISSVLTWAQRLRICVGVAKGLCYLHEELQPKIIHRDIKPQNILLDKDWNAKIADFGLARPVEGDATQMATHLGGTLGYFSPEYATQGLLSEKLDVYSYGILVLEIVAGRRCIQSSSPVEEIYLKNWALKMYKQGCLTKIAEERLLATVPEEEIESVLKTALLCLQDDHEKRPSMSQVVNMLMGNSADLAVDIVNELRDQQSFYHRLFDATIATANFSGKQEREDLSLLHSTVTSSSGAKGIIELSDAKAR